MIDLVEKAGEALPELKQKVIKLMTAQQEADSAHLWRMFPMMVEKVPAGVWGSVELKHVQLSEKQAYVVGRCRNELRTTHPQLQLNIDGTGWMFDTLHERWMNRTAVVNARGDVLVGGLGIGMILWPILKKRTVRSVTVLEINPDVIAAVLPTLEHAEGREKLRVIECDARQWEPEPGQFYDYIWLDMVPGYGYGLKLLNIHQEWLRHFAKWQRDWSESCTDCDHWGYQENLLWLLHGDTPQEEWPEADRRPYPIGPADPLVVAMLEELGKREPLDMTGWGLGAG